MNQLLKKVLIGTMAISAISTTTTSVWAKSSIELPQGIINFTKGDIWREASYGDKVPTITLIIENASEKAGKVESFDLTLTNAEWANGDATYLPVYDAQGVSLTEVTLTPKSHEKIKVDINIPEDIEEDEEIQLMIPLLITANQDGDEIYVNITGNKDTSLVDEGSFLVAAVANKRAYWEIKEVPTFEKEGTIAPILFTETNQGSIGTEKIEVIIMLEDDDYEFGEPEYLSKKSYTDTTEYKLDVNKYIEYSGGFEEEDQELRYIRNNNNPQEVRVVMEGSIPDKIGKILLKNLPVINCSSQIKDETLKATIEGNDLVGKKENITVAYVENTSKVEEEKEVEPVEEEQISKRIIKFTVGQNIYTIGDTTHKMDAEPFIQQPGYMMIPVRYVLEALGLGEDQMTYGGGLACITYANRTIELNVGSDIARVNGANIKMQTKVINKNGRLYIPIGEIAKLLGINKTWDAANKTAIFEK